MSIPFRAPDPASAGVPEAHGIRTGAGPPMGARRPPTRIAPEELLAHPAAVTRVLELGARALTTHDLLPLLEEALDASLELQGCDLGTLQLRPSEGAPLAVVVQRGFPADTLARLARSDDAQPACALALRTGAAVMVEDVEVDPVFARHRELASGADFRAVLSTPLFGRTAEPVGVLSLYFRKPHRPSRAQLWLADMYARQVGSLIEARRAEQALRRAKETAEEDAAAKGRLLAELSHEIRTPLNAILGYTQLLLDGVPEPVAEAVRRNLERIGASTRHLIELVNEVLTVARMDARGDELRVQPVRPALVVEEVRSMVEPLVRAKELLFHVRVGALPDTCETDPARLRQILVNLCSNAVNYTEQGGVTLEAGVERGELVFRVRDTGRGIAAPDLAEIFEPFSRAAGSSPSHPGTGLGLSISRRLASRLGGVLDVESEMGRGSTFTLRLPVAATRH